MLLSRKILILGVLAATVFISVAATAPGKGKDKNPMFRNLQVLPKNISEKQLNQIMIDEFEDDLGVTCNYCHAENKETHRPDYASDEKPEKKMARVMMRMTMGINKKYFGLGHTMIGDPQLAITCATCHQGRPRP